MNDEPIIFVFLSPTPFSSSSQPAFKANWLITTHLQKVDALCFAFSQIEYRGWLAIQTL